MSWTTDGIIGLCLVAALALIFWVWGATSRFAKRGLPRMARQNGWEIFSEPSSGQRPYTGDRRDMTKGLDRPKLHPDAPKGDSFEDIHLGVRGEWRGRRFVVLFYRIDMKTYGSFLIAGSTTIHLYTGARVPHMAIGANHERVSDVEGSDAVRHFGPRFHGWLQENWMRFGTLRGGPLNGGDDVIGMKVNRLTRRRLAGFLDFLSDTADRLPVEG